MHESELSRRSQIVVPASVRKELGLEPGDRVRFEPHPDGYLLRTARDATWVDRLVSVGGDELRGYAEQLLRERHGGVHRGGPDRRHSGRASGLAAAD